MSGRRLADLAIRVAAWGVVIVIALFLIEPQLLDAFTAQAREQSRAADREAGDRALAAANTDAAKRRLHAYRRRAQDCLDAFRQAAPPLLWRDRALVLQVIGGACRAGTCKAAGPAGPFQARVVTAIAEPTPDTARAVAAMPGALAADVPACARLFEIDDGMGFGSPDGSRFEHSETLAMTGDGALLYGGAHESLLRLHRTELEAGSLDDTRMYFRVAGLDGCGLHRLSCWRVWWKAKRQQRLDREMWSRPDLNDASFSMRQRFEASQRGAGAVLQSGGASAVLQSSGASAAAAASAALR